MSWFSRWFRKAPSRSTAPAATLQSTAAKTAEKALSDAGSAQRALAAFAEEKALRSAIDRQDFEVVARLVVAGTSTGIRRMAAEAIEDPDLLRQLIRDVRGGNDKGVYKILASKRRSEEHTSELQSLMRISYAVFCLKKK